MTRRPEPRLFGAFLRRTRKAAGIPLRVLARRLGVSAAYLSEVELGNRRPFDSERLARVARLLHVELSTLEVLAAETRGAFQLAPLSEAHRRAGRALMLAWHRLADDDLHRIIDLVEK